MLQLQHSDFGGKAAVRRDSWEHCRKRAPKTDTDILNLRPGKRGDESPYNGDTHGRQKDATVRIIEVSDGRQVAQEHHRRDKGPNFRTKASIMSPNLARNPVSYAKGLAR